MIQWIVVANSAQARIFRRVDNSKTSHLVGEIKNPLVHEKIADLVRHRFGISVKSSGHRGGIMRRTSGKKDVRQEITDHFAREVCEILNKGRLRKEFQKLSLIAASEVLGDLRKHLSKGTRATLTKSISKDLGDRKASDIQKYITTNDDLRIPVL